MSVSPKQNQSSLVRRAIALSWFTIGYNLLEGLVSISFGVKEESVSLAGFGIDSLIEVASAFLVLWRFQGEKGRGQALSISRERSATFGIGVLFCLLALTTAIASILQLTKEGHPETTVPGVIISTLSLSFMFFLWREKKRIAIALDSKTVMKDADCSLACIKLSFVLFLGSLLYLVLPSFWWVDGTAALFLSILVGKEGWETIKASKNKDFAGGCGCAH